MAEPLTNQNRVESTGHVTYHEQKVLLCEKTKLVPSLCTTTDLTLRHSSKLEVKMKEGESEVERQRGCAGPVPTVANEMKGRQEPGGPRSTEGPSHRGAENGGRRTFQATFRSSQTFGAVPQSDRPDHFVFRGGTLPLSAFIHYDPFPAQRYLSAHTAPKNASKNE